MALRQTGEVAMIRSVFFLFGIALKAMFVLNFN